MTLRDDQTFHDDVEAAAAADAAWAEALPLDETDAAEALPATESTDDAVSELEKNLRRFRRSDHIQPVRVAVTDQQGNVIDRGWAEVADLSPAGVRIRGLRLYRQTELTDDHRLQLDIVFDDGEMYVEVRSAPRWCSEVGELGLEFDNVDVRVV